MNQFLYLLTQQEIISMIKGIYNRIRGAKITPGMLKIIMDRELGYLSKFNFVMIAYLFFQDVGFYWWYLLGIPVFLVWVYIDLIYILPTEGEYTARKNPFLRRLYKNTEDAANNVKSNKTN